MRRMVMAGVTGLLLGAALVAALPAGAQAPQEIPLVIEKNRFQPDVIKVKAGAPFVLVITRGGQRLSLSRFFGVTTVFIMLLAAGLFSSGVGRLQGLGVLPLGYPVWDTAWLLSDKSLAGSFLSGLIGYRSQPSLPEICAYVAYLIAAAALLFGHRTPDAVGLADPTRR